MPEDKKCSDVRMFLSAIFLIGCGYYLAASEFTQRSIFLIPSLACLALAYLLLKDGETVINK